MKKAEQSHISLEHEAAFHSATYPIECSRARGCSESYSQCHFTGRPFDIELIKDSLKDLLALQDKQVSLDNIKRKVAEYYKLKWLTSCPKDATSVPDLGRLQWRWQRN